MSVSETFGKRCDAALRRIFAFFTVARSAPELTQLKRF
jgi:hypothetical protein